MQSGTRRSTSETTPSSAASVERGTPYEQLGTVDSLQDVATTVVFSPDGRFIAASDRSSMIIHRLDQEDFPAVKAPIQDGRRAFVALAWTYFEKRQLYNIVAGSFDGEVSLWRLEGECTHDDVQCAAPDLLVFAYQGGVIARLDHEGKSVVNVVKGPGTMASVTMLSSVDQFIAYTG
ncbi:hypothetical protein EV122DRAFT_227261, partial [Schizophyllum commune]